MLRALALSTCLAFPITLSAESGDAEALIETMQLQEMVDIMRAEGLDYGEELGADGARGPGWMQVVDRIYDAERMMATMETTFTAALGDTDMGPMLEFFRSDDGQEVIALELSAREAMMDEAVEEAAREAFRVVEDTDDARLAQIDDFVAANDLIESNVVGALNANIVFFRGMADGGASDLTEDQIFANAWAQEEETRADTREWVYGFLLMAYRPLADDVLDTYTELSDTEAGDALNQALFAGFNAMYEEISYALGVAMARQAQVQEL